MPNPTRGPSLLQARDQAHSHAHSLFHRIRHNFAGERRHYHGHTHDRAHVVPNHHHDSNDVSNDQAELAASEVRGENEQDSSSRSTEASHDEEDAREIRAVTEKIVLNAVKDTSNSLITQVIQTISLVQYVDPWGNAFDTKTVAGPPNTVVVDAKTGKTVAISVGALEATVALPGSSPGGSSSDSSSPTTTSTRPTTAESASLSSSGSSGSQTSTLSSITSAHASIGTDIRNSTNTVVHGNSTFIPPANASNSNSSSLYKPLVFSAPVSLPVTDGTTTSRKVLTTQSSYYTTSSSLTTTSPDDNDYSTLTVAGSKPTTSSDAGSGGGGGVNLSSQQKQVIGGVVGAVAGVAILGLLLMLFLRYKKRKEGRTIMDSQNMGNASRSLGDGTSGGSGGGSGSAMAERSSASASAAVAAALASLTGKRTTPPQTADSGERGFYRVSGRKLPPVLYNGGDGYSDPRQQDGDNSSRESARSGTSDYYRGSQAFDPAAAGGAGQLSLGAPMRPVSGIPIMRSGPARVPVTENPFQDPPSTPPHNSSGRTLGSRESPRASGSRFQERI